MPLFLRWLLRMGPLNPIAVRLVQNASRRRKHLLVRAAYLAVLIIVLLWMLLLTAASASPSYRDLAQAGAASFTVIAYLQIALICILAPVFMASAIAQEASPRTWDILLTTPMGPGQIVLGNLFGRLFFIIALLLASLPLFALTQYYGGVPGTAILASYAVAGSAALLVGTIAIALSVSRLVGRRAVFAFYIGVVSYLAITAAGDAFARSRGWAAEGGSGVTVFTGLNPFLALRALLNPAGYPRAEAGAFSGLHGFFLSSPVTAWCTLCAGVSLLLMIGSAITVRIGGLQTFAGPRSSKVPWYRKIMGLGASGSEYRPPRSVWPNPIAWREAAARNSTFGKILGRWAFIAAGLLVGLLLTAAFHFRWIGQADFRIALLSLVWTESAIITLIAINISATAVSREREDGTLDLLLTTPMTPGTYLYGKLRGLITYLVPLLLVPIGTLAFAGIYVFIAELAGAAGVMVTTPGGGPPVPIVLPEASVLLALTLVPFSAFCVMVGLNWSLKSKGTIGSMVWTVAIVGAVGGFLGLCGWQASVSTAVIGPTLAAMNPISTIYAAVAPDEGMQETLLSGGWTGLTAGRIALVIGALISAGIYLAVVYGIHAGMVRGFDFTVRKLAGTR